MNADADRLDALEVRVAYQDRIIEELNEALTAQWRQVDLLTRQIAKLKEAVAEAQSRAERTGAPEPPPPHY